MSTTRSVVRRIRSKKELLLDAATVTRFREKGMTDERLAELQSISSAARIWRFVYRSNGHDVAGFLAVPRASRRKVPCVIYNRGGYGDAEGLIKPHHAFMALARMSSWGYVVIASQYSGNDGMPGLDECGGSDVDDVLALRKLLVEVPQADTTRIGMVGMSRGAMMTYLCLARVRWLRCAVGIGGATNLLRASDLVSTVRRVFKMTLKVNNEELRKRSAALWPEKLAPKTALLIAHGTADNRVSPQDSIDLAAEMVKLGRHPGLVLFPGGDHLLTGAYTEPKWRLVREWLDKHLLSAK